MKARIHLLAYIPISDHSGARRPLYHMPWTSRGATPVLNNPLPPPMTILNLILIDNFD